MGRKFEDKIAKRSKQPKKICKVIQFYQSLRNAKQKFRYGITSMWKMKPVEKIKCDEDV